MSSDYYPVDETLNISDNEIHLWCVHDQEIQDRDLLEYYYSLLNEAEKRQQKRFHFDKHRHQYLITRALLRSVLSFYSSAVAPDEWVFGKNQYGKPFIENSLLTVPLYFNLSHTENMIILAVSSGDEIGVDVEHSNRKVRVQEFAKGVFSPLEFEQLCALPMDAQKERFFDLWTLKEAYIKACGMGLSIPLSQFSYFFPEPDRVAIEFDPRRNDAQEYWNFWCLRTNASHKIALAIKNANLHTTYDISMREVRSLSEIKARDFSIIRQSA